MSSDNRLKGNVYIGETSDEEYYKGSSDPAKLFPYTPPVWAERLQQLPTVRVKLIQPFTPIYKWKLPNIPNDIELSIKRDDMTGVTLSGNKARKLEFLLGDALNKKCQSVITIGDSQSNHCRSTAVAARQLGLEPHLLIRSSSDDPDEIMTEGNMFLDMLVGSSIYLIPKGNKSDEEARIQKLAALLESRNQKTYSIVGGGSSVIGLYGYIDAWQELVEQGILERFDDVAVTAGSGGTVTGIAIANYLSGSKLRVHAYIIRHDKAFLINYVNKTLKEVGLDGEVTAEDIIDIVEGPIGLGYAISTPEEIEFIKEVSMKTSVILDPTYTGKAALGLVKQLNSDRSAFKGTRILFIHTGGIFGCYYGQFKNIFQTSPHRNMQGWLDMDSEPTVTPI